MSLGTILLIADRTFGRRHTVLAVQQRLGLRSEQYPRHGVGRAHSSAMAAHVRGLFI